MSPSLLMMRQTIRAELRPAIWLLVLLLAAGQTQAVAHLVWHISPALAAAGAGHIDTHTEAGHGELSLSCELCAAGHLTLLHQTASPASPAQLVRWAAPAPEQSHTRLPPPRCCRGPPQHA